MSTGSAPSFAGGRSARLRAAVAVGGRGRWRSRPARRGGGPDRRDEPSGPEGGKRKPPAYVSAVDGTARIDREGRSEIIESGMPVVAGDRLRAEKRPHRSSRSPTAASFISIVSPTSTSRRIPSSSCRAAVCSRHRIRGDECDTHLLEAPGASVRIDQPGQYRLDRRRHRSRRGRARRHSRHPPSCRTTTGPSPSIPARRRRSSRRAGAHRTAVVRRLRRHGARALGRRTHRHVARRLRRHGTIFPPSSMSYGSTFDRYGSWQVDATYGSVWYPTVAVDWRPYYRGRWHHVPRCGWTWIAHDPWGWPTHHYGRWHSTRGGSWFWIPSRRWGCGLGVLG